ncbi:hypothetical protein F8568_032610 [Actinomadura sp. LD22]|uniref:Clp R domain-containing protein n=1 Tax=Actinomadura physcomitrii TaxID=2650748 RepID=A0A6I4MH20_9ACTN|nr:Clp protease N-terminal domain-containing protein [Actinomadura physcomitrii]MWA05023.1 hypothetical protein [Actinomadura physcomitrii]
MFERFTKDARRVVVLAQEEARMLGDHHVGTEHVLVGLVGDATVGAALREHGLDAADLRARITAGQTGDALDPGALRSIGIDLDAVREATEQMFGEGALDVPAGKLHRYARGHIPFTAEAKKAVQLSLRHAVRLKHKEIRSGHILLGILHDDGFAAARLATAAGADTAALRAEVTRLITTEAA